MEVGIIGLGRMGAGIAENIIRAGHRVTVWNRSPQAAAPLLELGAIAAASSAEAMQGDMLISMLADDKAFSEVGLDGALLRQARKSLVHVNTSTVSLGFSRRLASVHAEQGLAYVAATVFGRADIAAAGTLTVVVAGEAKPLEIVMPILRCLGQNVFVVGEDPDKASLVKLAGVLMLAAVIESFGEALALVQKGGVDPRMFYEIMTADLFSAPAYKNYGRIIVEKEYEPPGFLLRLGLKDQSMVLAAGAELNVPLPLVSLVRDQLIAAMAKGLGEQDWVAFAEVIAANAGLSQ